MTINCTSGRAAAFYSTWLLRFVGYTQPWPRTDVEQRDRKSSNDLTQTRWRGTSVVWSLVLRVTWLFDSRIIPWWNAGCGRSLVLTYMASCSRNRGRTKSSEKTSIMSLPAGNEWNTHEQVVIYHLSWCHSTNQTPRHHNVGEGHQVRSWFSRTKLPKEL